jgi:hypothetical protein
MPCLKTKKHHNNHLHPLLIWNPWAPRIHGPKKLLQHFFQRRHRRHLGQRIRGIRRKSQLGLVDTAGIPLERTVEKNVTGGIHMNSYLSRAISEQIWFMKFMVPKYWKETRKGENAHDDKLSFWWGQYVFVIFLLNLQSVVFPVILSILMICPLWGLGVNKLSSSHSLSRPSK